MDDINISIHRNITLIPVYNVIFSSIVSSLSILFGIALLFVIYKMSRLPEGSELRPGSRRLIVWLTVADVIRASLTVVGMIRFVIHYSDSQRDLRIWECEPSRLCLALGCLHIWANLSVHCWTLSIATYFVLKSMRRHRSRLTSGIDSISTTFHFFGWGLPILPVMFAFTFGSIGENFSIDIASGLCGITSCNHEKKTELVWVAITSKMWEIILIIMTFGIYIWYKANIYLQKRKISLLTDLDILPTYRSKRAFRNSERFENPGPSTSSAHLYRSELVNSSTTISNSTSGAESTATKNSSSGMESTASIHNSAKPKRRRRLNWPSKENNKNYMKEPQEENLFCLLIIFLYLGRCWGLFRFLIAVIFQDDMIALENSSVYVISQVFLVLQSLGDCSQALLNFIVFWIHCSQARKILRKIYM